MKGGNAKTAERCYASTGIIALPVKPNTNDGIACVPITTTIHARASKKKSSRLFSGTDDNVGIIIAHVNAKSIRNICDCTEGKLDIAIVGIRYSDSP